MLWIKTVVHTTTAGIEPVSGILLLNGINGYEVQDSEDFKDFLAGKEIYFDYIEDELMQTLTTCETTVTFYVPENAQGLETILAVKAALSRLALEDTDHVFGALRVENDEKLAEEDWENNWKQYFKPFPVGERLLIKPTWERLPAPTDRAVLEIDPSSSFGTGSHATTRLCLETLEKLPLAGANVLDMGSGSGILGIACLKLGAKAVTAVDIDENSVRIAKENYAVNHLDEAKYRVLCGNVLTDEALCEEVAGVSYNVIAANIVADIIMWMAPLFKRVLAADGTLVVSGIITERAGEVVTALEKAGFAVNGKTETEGWAVVTLCHASL